MRILQGGLWLNSTVVDLVVTLYQDGTSAPLSSDGIGGYFGGISSTTGMITLVIESGTLAGDILWIWSEIF